MDPGLLYKTLWITKPEEPKQPDGDTMHYVFTEGASFFACVISHPGDKERHLKLCNIDDDYSVRYDHVASVLLSPSVKVKFAEATEYRTLEEWLGEINFSGQYGPVFPHPSFSQLISDRQIRGCGRSRTL
jgi:hypothetical protein